MEDNPFNLIYSREIYNKLLSANQKIFSLVSSARFLNFFCLMKSNDIHLFECPTLSRIRINKCQKIHCSYWLTRRGFWQRFLATEQRDHGSNFWRARMLERFPFFEKKTIYLWILIICTFNNMHILWNIIFSWKNAN